MAKPKQQPHAPQNALADLLRHASRHHQRGQLPEAEVLYRKVLALQPNNFDALHLCGVLMHQRGRPVEALTLIGQALKTNARAAPAHSNYGVVLAALERHAEAVDSYQRAVALKPDYADAFKNLGNALCRLGRDDEALASYEAALAIDPYNVDLLLAHGNTLYALRRFEAALTAYDRVLTLRPDLARVLNNRGNALCDLGRKQEALESFEHALALLPDSAEVHNNRGIALLDLNRPAEAMASFDRALELKPGYAEALLNRGNALRDLSRSREAIASYNAALTLKPDMAEAHWNKGLEQLLLGEFEQGWANYEWRWRRAHAERRDFTQPLWRGENLRGKTILLHTEQGFGDSIQFLRYLPMVAARGAHIILELPDALMPLVGDSGVTLVSRGARLPAFDLHCPLMSLPLAFGTTLATVPAQVPYLRTPANRIEKWRARLPRTDRLRIGLTWSGKPSHLNDHNRSVALARLMPLLSVEGVDFVSLQRDVRDTDRAMLEALPNLRRLDDAFADFADTAGAIEQLDLVIAVDTAVAHLAGALNRPVWILLPAILDWRWLLAREDSPWYPSARLFRQPAIGDWDSVIARLVSELAVFAKAPAAATH